jgi:aminotransferase
MNNHNQYAITWGTKNLRDAIVAKTQRDYGVTFDPETNLTVCCGATEGMIAR